MQSEETDSAFHLIPANIHGDNNLEFSEPGHFPVLTGQEHESEFSAPLWEFRADRAPYPLSALCLKDRVLAISVDPYSSSEGDPSGYIANGLYAELPGTCGISLGYGNTPVQFINKEEFGPASQHRSTQAACKGRIYQEKGDRRALHKILRSEYELRKDRPTANESVETAAKALCDAFVQTNFSEELGNYSNMTLNLEGHRYLRPWRPLIEIGWTRGGPLAYPLIKAEQLLGLKDSYFDKANPGSRFSTRFRSTVERKAGSFTT